MKKLLCVFALSCLTFLPSCRYVSYRTPDKRELTIIACGTDTKVGNLTATAGDTTLTFKNYDASVDAASVKALNDAILLAIDIASKIPSTIPMVGDSPTTQLLKSVEQQNQYEVLQTALNSVQELSKKLPVSHK